MAIETVPGALSPVIAIALVGGLGVGSQWLAWRLRMPAIVLMLLAGIIIGPVLGVFDPARDIGPLMAPIIAIAVAIILYSGLGGHWILIAMIVFASLPLILLQFILLALPMQPISMRRRLLGYLVPLAVISVPFTDWPIRVNFKLHQASLQAVADRVASGEKIAGEISIGTFRFRRVGTTYNHEDHIGFQINGGFHGGMYFVATPPGFVPGPSSRQPTRNHGGVWNNTNWTVDLGDGWFLVDQD